MLVVQVEETQYRFLDVALGVRSIQRANIGRVPAWAASGAGVLVDQGDRFTTGFGRAFPLDIPDLLLTFDFEYIDLNSLGIGNRLQIPFDAGFSLSQFLRLATFNPSYTFPRVFDSTLTLTTRGIAEFDRVTDPLDRLELGLEGDLSVPLSDEMIAGVNARAGIVVVHVPYRGIADATKDLLGGTIQAMTASIPATLPLAAEKRVKVLAVTGSKRIPQLPDVPSWLEEGIDNASVINYWGVVAPVGTPAAVVAKLNADMQKVLAQPEVRERLEREGAEVIAGPPQRLGTLIEGDLAHWKKLIVDAKLSFE